MNNETHIFKVCRGANARQGDASRGAEGRVQVTDGEGCM